MHIVIFPDKAHYRKYILDYKRNVMRQNFGETEDQSGWNLYNICSHWGYMRNRCRMARTGEEMMAVIDDSKHTIMWASGLNSRNFFIVMLEFCVRRGDHG